MKKVSVKNAVKKFIAVTTAALMLGSGMAFFSCSSDSDDENETQQQQEEPKEEEDPNKKTDEEKKKDDEVVEEESGDFSESLVYDFDEITITDDDGTVGTQSLFDGGLDVVQTAAGKIKITANKEGNHHYVQASCGATTLSELAKQTGYFKVKAAQAGKEKIVFSFTTVKSTKGESENYIVLVDENDNELGRSEVVKCPTSDDNTVLTREIVATVPEYFYVVFVRGAGSGGFKFSKIEQFYAKPKAEQAAPVATDFAVVDPASASAKGTITYNGEKVSVLQYKEGDSWYKWGAEKGAAKEFGAGKVSVRYGSTDTEKTSEVLELEIKEYVNADLQAASAPAAGSVTSTATTSAEDNDGTLVIDTETEKRALEYKLGEGSWKDFAEGKATGLASGTYTIRVKASDSYNASEETISVIVKKFTAAPDAANFTTTVASDENAVDGKITAKSADVAANLMIVGAGAEGADASWSEIAGRETPLAITVKAGTYKAYYAETETTTKSAESEIVVGVKVYFKSFVAGTDVVALGGKNGDSKKEYKAADETWKVSSADFQLVDSNNNPVASTTYDYVEGSAGYSYEGRIKVKKDATFTINTKADTIIRIDGGSVTSGDKRTFTITGADKESWASEGSSGSFWLKATAETVTLKASNDIAIYGIHVVADEVAPVALESTTTYSVPVVELSKTSVVKDAEVTITTTIPKAVKKTSMSDGSVAKVEEDVLADISYTGATVTDGKVDTSSEGTLTITVSYTIGEGESAKTYTSEAVTLEVSAGFAVDTEEYTNDAATLGLVATTATSNKEDVATVEIAEGKLVITSVAAGTATITFGDGTNTGTIDVTVKASGEIEAVVKPYSAATADSWTISSDFYTTLTTEAAKDNYTVKGNSNVLNATFYKSGVKGHAMTTTTNKVAYAAYAEAYSGGKVKSDFLKIADVKGKVKLTIEWAMNSAKDADNRYVEVTAGNDKEKCERFGCNNKKGAQTAVTKTIEAGVGTDIYIGASDEVVLVSVKIEAAE